MNGIKVYTKNNNFISINHLYFKSVGFISLTIKWKIYQIYFIIYNYNNIYINYFNQIFLNF